MLDRVDLFDHQGQRRVAAMLERDFEFGAVFAGDTHINLLDARTRANHHFNRLAIGMRNTRFYCAAQRKPQRSAKAQEQCESKGLGMKKHFFDTVI